MVQVACGEQPDADEQAIVDSELDFDSTVPGDDEGITDAGLDAQFDAEVESLSVEPSAATANCPTAARNGGAALWSNLEACGWPGPGNTGPTSASLARRGSAVLDRDNQVLKDVQVDGCIVVTGKNVTISNVRVNFVPGGMCSSNAGMAAINIATGASATVRDTEVDGNGQVHIGIRNAGSSQSIVRVNVHDTEDGVFANLPTASRSAYPAAGSNTTIRDSYFHHFVPRSFNNKVMVDANRPNGHIDGVQTEGGAINTVIHHNTFQMNFGVYTARYTNGSTKAPANESNGYIDAATALWNGVNRDLRNVIVSNNLFAAKGGFIHYAYDRTGRVNGVCADRQSTARPNECGSVLTMKFKNNRYSTIYGECVGGEGIWFPRGTPTGGWQAAGNERSGNVVIETGDVVNATGLPRTSGGASCE